MGKITQEKLNKYQKINKEGGINNFKINLSKIIYGFSHGDEYPQFKTTIFEDEQKRIDINIYYFKYYNKEGEYIIKASELKKEAGSNFLVTGTGYFQKKYITESNNRFNFNKLKQIVQNVDYEYLKEIILNDYKFYKGE